MRSNQPSQRSKNKKEETVVFIEVIRRAVALGESHRVPHGCVRSKAAVACHVDAAADVDVGAGGHVDDDDDDDVYHQRFPFPFPTCLRWQRQWQTPDQRKNV